MKLRNTSNSPSKLVAAAIKHPDLMLEAVDRFLANAERREMSMSLAGFVKAFWHVLEPNTPLQWTWHLQAMCDHLEAITDGRIQHLIINIPPGYMKSLIVAVFWTAWEWGPRNMAHFKVLSTSYKEDHARRDARKTRILIEHPDYQALWGDQVKIIRGGEADFETEARGWRKARSITSLTGDRGDRLIVDDPHSTEMAESEAERFKSQRVLTESALTRLNHPESSSIVLIMQRLHQDDATGVLLKSDLNFVHLCLPMSFEKARRCKTKIGFRDPRLYEGELLAPERIGPAKLRELTASMGPHAIACQFQQNPVPREGVMFKRDWFTIVETYPMHGTIVRAWDLAGTAEKAGRDPDWTVGLKVMLGPDGRFYITDMIRRRVEVSDLVPLIRMAKDSDERHCMQILPQDPGVGGKFAADHITRELGYRAAAFLAQGDKRQRAGPPVMDARLGKFTLVRGPWNEAFLNEVTSFPAGSHDDIVDALSLAHEYLTINGGYNILAALP